MLGTARALPSVDRRFGRSGSRGQVSLLARLLGWAELSRQRRDLFGLSPHQLRDIGLDARAAAAEAGRPFWDAPAGWR
ncbi:MAG: DUF1127 domain-containing protein [Pseudomonadota bacterium]